MDLLPKHWHMLEEDIGELCGSISGCLLTWVALVDAAFAAVDHVSADLPMVNAQAAYITHPCRQRTCSQLDKGRAASASDTQETT